MYGGVAKKIAIGKKYSYVKTDPNLGSSASEALERSGDGGERKHETPEGIEKFRWIVSLVACLPNRKLLSTDTKLTVLCGKKKQHDGQHRQWFCFASGGQAVKIDKPSLNERAVGRDGHRRVAKGTVA